MPETFASTFRDIPRSGRQPRNVISIANPLEGNEIDLEGNKLVVVRLGHTDTDDSTCLHAPSIGLVVAGDVVYNGIHPFLSESNRQTRLEWIAALDKIDALKPSAVVAGHKIPGNDDSPRHVEETRQYIRDFIRLNDATKTAAEPYDKMLELYPDRVNPGSPLECGRYRQGSVVTGAGASERDVPAEKCRPATGANDRLHVTYSESLSCDRHHAPSSPG